MFRFLFAKSLRVLAALVGVSALMFLLVRAIPGSPWSNYSTNQQINFNFGSDAILQRELDRRFGLDLPLWRQFTRYLIGDVDREGQFFCGAVCGNLGPSTQQRGRTVQAILFAAPEGVSRWDSRFGYSLRLVLLGTLIAVGVGIPLGLMSATAPNSAAGRAVSVGLAALIAIPNFVLGLLAIIVLASWLKVIKVLPQWDDPRYWLVPAVVLAVMPLASLARVTRAAVLDIIHRDYIRTARAKGLPQRRVLFGHVLRNALAPILTFVGPTVMEMFVGLLVVENLYAFPGFGQEYWKAVLALDYPMVLGLTLIYAAGLMLVTLAVESVCAALDPRLRSLAVKGEGG